VLVAAGVVAGVILALVWTYRLSWGVDGPKLSPRFPATYVTSINAVIDTAQFGLGRSDTDMYRLALMAPTYAQLLVSEPVLQDAEKSLGAPIDALVLAKPVESSPIVQLTVQGTDRVRLRAIALAVVDAFRTYVSDSQAENQTPVNLRLTIRGIDRPTEPQPVSNRQSEIALILFSLPIAAAVVLASRIEHSTENQANCVVQSELQPDAEI